MPSYDSLKVPEREVSFLFDLRAYELVLPLGLLIIAHYFRLFPIKYFYPVFLDYFSFNLKAEVCLMGRYLHFDEDEIDFLNFFYYFYWFLLVFLVSWSIGSWRITFSTLLLGWGFFDVLVFWFRDDWELYWLNCVYFISDPISLPDDGLELLPRIVLESFAFFFL